MQNSLHLSNSISKTFSKTAKPLVTVSVNNEHVLQGDGQTLKSAADEGAHRQHLVTFGEVEQRA